MLTVNEPNIELKVEHFDCVCYNSQHTMRFVVDQIFEDAVEFSIDLQVRPDHGFWRRVRNALKYVFGRYELTYEGLAPQRKDIPRMIRVLTDFYNLTEPEAGS